MGKSLICVFPMFSAPTQLQHCARGPFSPGTFIEVLLVADNKSERETFATHEARFNPPRYFISATHKEF